MVLVANSMPVTLAQDRPLLLPNQQRPRKNPLRPPAVVVPNPPEVESQVPEPLHKPQTVPKPALPATPPSVPFDRFPAGFVERPDPVVKVFRLTRYPVSKVKPVLEQLKDSYIERGTFGKANPFTMTSEGSYPAGHGRQVIMQRPDGSVGVVDLDGCVFSLNERANAVVFRTNSETKMKRVAHLIAVLDAEPKKELPKSTDLFALRLRHAVPSDIEATLKPLKLEAQVVCFDSGKLLFVVGETRRREQIRKVIEQLDVPESKFMEKQVAEPTPVVFDGR